MHAMKRSPSVMLCRTLSLGALFALSIVSTSVESQRGLEHVPMAGTVLSESPVYFEPGLRPGVLRIVISGVRKAGWSILLKSEGAGQLLLDAESVKARTVHLRETELRVDVPLMRGTVVTAIANQTGLEVRALEAITLRSIFTEQMIENSDVKSLGATSTTEELRLAGALAKVELLGETSEMLGFCTAFRVAKGYWMTAAHCAYRDETRSGDPIVQALRMQTGVFAGTMGGAIFLGTVVASGIRTLPVTQRSIVRITDLDYVMIEAPDDPGGTVLAIETIPLVIGDSLALFHYWGGNFLPAEGFAKSEGASCKVRTRIGTNEDYSRPDLCPHAIQHGCSSQAGSSGAPLVNRSGRIVALHYGAGTTSKFNCALPVATVMSHLCLSNPSLARKVTSCP